jgi:hypothetical protein
LWDVEEFGEYEIFSGIVFVAGEERYVVVTEFNDLL